ncbi:gamma-glutamyltransferase [Flammeovirga pacifica]|uniref:Glutathione hydrolase proenzyme n=1 Tax=Flammeovirga pacifica TaxID=915059 RepID=A0A1S1YVY3_FLAPC|nr:gamma-glutamyltransferase [Flammeovirga pacifica]OHX65188.1 gamma-glutamyltransferase [Flammeovirga pacifica]
MNKFYCIIVLILFCGCSHKKKSNQKEVGTIASQAMISTAHPLASQIGLNILKKGGNAFDAAIATQFALAVAYPRAGNIGGGGFMVYRKSNAEVGSLDFREKAPQLASKNMYLDDSGNPIKDLSLKGALAIGVPGTVDGMVQIHQKLGSLPWEDLLQPAIDLALEGVVLTEAEANKINQYITDFQQVNLRPIPFTKNNTWKKGERIIYTSLANTLKIIQKNKRDGFYKGEIAQHILQSMKKHRGIIQQNDLDAYSSKWRKPVQVSFQDSLQLISMPPPSSGGIALAQILKSLDEIDSFRMSFNDVEWVHTLVELERRAYADRSTHLGDADFIDVPQEWLLSDNYIKSRLSNFDPHKATPSQEIKAGSVQTIESFETTHFSIVDKYKNAVSITTTLNGNFGSKLYVENAGFFLNNEMDDFSIKPGVPNQFGLVGGRANEITPEKRMLSSMTPSIVLKNNELFLVVGTPGGSTIITSVLQTILNVTQFGMSMQEAVNAKKFHSQWLPDKIYYEDGALNTTTIKQLESMGHQLEKTEQLGKMDCILIVNDSTIEGASDVKRGDGRALGY